MAMRLQATYEDGSVKTATIKPGDLVRFERHFGMNWDEVQKSPRAEHTFFLLWTALKRSGQEDCDFEAFLDTIDDLDDPDAGEEPAPLEAPAS